MHERNGSQPYYGLALAYRRSADLLLEQIAKAQTREARTDLPVRFLYSHTVELLLKAFLRLRGFEVDVLANRPYGHDLVALYDECNKLDLALADTDKRSLSVLIPYLEAGHGDYQFRYSEKSFSTADPNWMRRDVGKLADAVAAAVKNDNQAAEQEAKDAGMVRLNVPVQIIVSIGFDE
jgi:hypothetical protein